MGCLWSREAGGEPARPQRPSDPRERLMEVEQACATRLDTVQNLLEDSAHARSQAQWLRELIAAYSADLQKCQQDLTGYSRYSDGEDESVRVGDRRHLAEKLHGVSAKQKKELQAALNGIVSRARVEIGFCEQELAWCSAQLRDLNRLASKKAPPSKAADFDSIRSKVESLEETYLHTLQRTYNECKLQLQAVIE